MRKAVNARWMLEEFYVSLWAQELGHPQASKPQPHQESARLEHLQQPANACEGCAGHPANTQPTGTAFHTRHTIPDPTSHPATPPYLAQVTQYGA
jgi:ATP-dependent helicase HrpA